MNLKLLFFTFTLSVLSSFNSNSQTALYGVAPSDVFIFTYDTTTMVQTASVIMTSPTGTVTGATGLCADQCGTLYVVYKVGSSRYLGTINPANGSIVPKGLFSDNISNITFVNGVLYGVTGDGSMNGPALWTIDINTAAMSFVTLLGNGNDGESIEFNPEDGLIYHWSGWGSGFVVMETIDPATNAITPITLSGSSLANVGASTYAGNGRFLISDVNQSGLKYITSAGVVSATPNTSIILKGLAFAVDNGVVVDVVNTTAPNDSICNGETAVLMCNNVGVTYEWFLNGNSTGNTTNTLNATVQGTYACQINDGTCTYSSASLPLIVSNTPTTNITPSPNASFCAGDSVELTLNTGGGSASFQWYLDGAMISGATGSSYFASTAGSYNATKTNIHGCSDSSAVATVVTASNYPTVNITPSPTAEFCAGDSVELSVNSGGGAASVQWYLNGTMISGATNNSYFASAEGVYNATKTNTAGCSDSSAVSTMAIDTCVNSISELNTLSFTIYPNPASEFVTIDFGSTAEFDLVSLKLVGLDGKLVREFVLDDSNYTTTSINVSDIHSGVYFIRFETSLGQIVKEVIIE